MREQQVIERIDFERAEIAQKRVAIFSASVDKQCFPVGKFDQGGVALPHVDKVKGKFALGARLDFGK